MIAEIKQRDVIGPNFLRKCVEAFDFGLPTLISQKAQRARNLQRIVEAALFHIGLADEGQRRTLFALEETFHGGESRRLQESDVLALLVAGGERHQRRRDNSGDHTDAHKCAAVGLRPLHQEVKRAHRGHGEAAGHHRADHIMQILPEQPGVQQQRPEAGQHDFAVRPQRVAYGMLHPGVGGYDEEAGKPRSQENQKAGEPMRAGAQSFFAEQKQAQEARLQEEREHAFHGERLSDHSACGF